MNIKKTNKYEYEIETSESLIYITKEKNPGTENLFIYFIDIFTKNENNKYEINNIAWGENFDDLDAAIDYIYYNYKVPAKITDQIKFERN